MNSVRAWMVHFGEGDASAWRGFVASMREEGVLLSGEPEGGIPGLALLNGPVGELLEELSQWKQRGTGPVLVIAHRRSELVGQGPWQLLRAGANDVLALDEFENPAASTAARLGRLTEIEELVRSPVVSENLVGQSESWRGVLRQVVEVARFSGGSLLITGESGTGKELVARLVHTLDARVDKGNLVILDCATVSPGLSGSEFFGHERGAFTNAVSQRDGAMALAHRGTLFLDEVGELPVTLQAELLRAVQERSYKRVGSNTWKKADFRLICATNRDLAVEEARGNFRLDFYHRIACSRCHLPPLRERRDDILPLARHFLREILQGAEPSGFDPVVEAFLISREYPGNIRELRQLVARMASRHAGPGPVTVGSIPPEDRAAALELVESDWRSGDFETAIRRALASGAGLQEIRDQTVDAVIRIALSDAAGNLQRAAVKLHVTDRALQMRRAARKEEQGYRP